MKKLLTLSVLFSFSLFAFAQEQYSTKKPKPVIPVPENRPEKGKIVFIKCDNPQEDRILPHMKDRIEKWGYWIVTGSKDSADFFIELVVRDKAGPITKGFAILKQKDGIEITRSKDIRTEGDPGNGFSQWRGFSIGVGKWLKGEKL